MDDKLSAASSARTTRRPRSRHLRRIRRVVRTSGQKTIRRSKLDPMVRYLTSLAHPPGAGSSPTPPDVPSTIRLSKSNLAIGLQAFACRTLCLGPPRAAVLKTAGLFTGFVSHPFSPIAWRRDDLGMHPGQAARSPKCQSPTSIPAKDDL